MTKPKDPSLDWRAQQRRISHEELLQVIREARAKIEEKKESAR